MTRSITTHLAVMLVACFLTFTTSQSVSARSVAPDRAIAAMSGISSGHVPHVHGEPRIRDDASVRAVRNSPPLPAHEFSLRAFPGTRAGHRLGERLRDVYEQRSPRQVQEDFGRNDRIRMHTAPLRLRSELVPWSRGESE